MLLSLIETRCIISCISLAWGMKAGNELHRIHSESYPVGTITLWHGKIRWEKCGIGLNSRITASIWHTPAPMRPACCMISTMKTQHPMDLYHNMNIKVSIRIGNERETCWECRLIWDEGTTSGWSRPCVHSARSTQVGVSKGLIREKHRSWWLYVRICGMPRTFLRGQGGLLVFLNNYRTLS